MYSANGTMGAKMIGNQVIGTSPEQCYGEGIPVGTNYESIYMNGVKYYVYLR